MPGNNGLKDQNLALKWIKVNVKAFGGDPNSITLFGESCGGASVHMHMMSPRSKGLFHRGISESGTALALWNFGQRDKAINVSKEFALSFGCSSTNSRKLINCLRQVKAYDLVKNSGLFVVSISRKILLFVIIENI